MKRVRVRFQCVPASCNEKIFNEGGLPNSAYLYPQVFPIISLFAACNAATANQENLKPERWLLTY